MPIKHLNRVNCDLTDSQLALVEDLARRYDINRTELLRRCIAYALSSEHRETAVSMLPTFQYIRPAHPSRK